MRTYIYWKKTTGLLFHYKILHQSYQEYIRVTHIPIQWKKHITILSVEEQNTAEASTLSWTPTQKALQILLQRTKTANLNY